MGASRRRGAIIVFAKDPRPGAVKTRLTPPLSPGEAAGLYACMLDDVLELTARAARELDLEALLAVDPPTARAALAARAPAPFHAVAQRGPDLSARMAHAVLEAAAGGASPVLLRGSDSPALTQPVLRGAVRALAERADLVVCPDRDGGYNLVGLRRPAAGVFGHAMSTARVLDDTLARGRLLGLRAEVLEPGFDVDVAADLERLAAARRRDPALPCVRTLAFLDGRGLWSRVDTARGRRRERA